MNWGGTPWGGGPWGGGPLVDGALPAPFEVHLEQLDREDVYRLEAYPRIASGTKVLVEYTDVEWIGKPMIPATLRRAVEFQGSVPSLFGSSAGGSPQFGAIEIVANTFETSEGLDLAFLSALDWHGAVVRMRMGAPDFSYEQFQPVFGGRAIDMIRNARGFEIVIGDPSIALNVPMQTETYLGTGGVEGDARVKGQYRPWGEGVVTGSQPVLIDRVNGIWQYNLEESASFDALMEDGRAGGWIRDADVPDIFASAAPAGGHYHVEDPAGGRSFMKTGGNATQLGAMTCHFTGVRTTAADIVEHVSRQFAGQVNSDFDLPSFAQLNIDYPYPIGIFTGQSNPTVSQVVRQIMGGSEPVGVPLGFHTWDRLGRMRVGVHKQRPAVRTIYADQIASVRREQTVGAFWSWGLGYAPNWTVIAPDAVSPAASAAEFDFATLDFRRIEPAVDLVVKGNKDLPNSIVLNTLLANEADADTVAAQALALSSASRDLHELEVYDHQYLIGGGDTVEVDAGVPDAGHDLQAGDYLALGHGESSQTKRTQLLLWGPL